MLSGRSWPIDFWMSVWLEHPLLAHLARRTIWMAHTGARDVAIIPTLENDFHDARYEDVELPPQTRLSVAHPVSLDVDAWHETLADLAIVQPFPQIERPTSAVPDSTAVVGAELIWDTLQDRIARGWQARTTGTIENRRDELVFAYGGFDVGITIEPGLVGTEDRRSLADHQETQTITDVWARSSERERTLPFDEWPMLHRYELGLLLRAEPA
jgi:hypothetical protein